MRIIIGLFLTLILLSSLYVNSASAVSNKEKNNTRGDLKKYLSLLYACLDRGSDIPACMIKFEDQLLRNEIFENYASIGGGYRESVTKDPLLNHPTYFLKAYPNNPQQSLNWYELYVSKAMSEIITRSDSYSKMKDVLLQHSYDSLRYSSDSSGTFGTGKDCVQKKKIGYDGWMTVSCDGSKVSIDRGTDMSKKLRQTTKQSSIISLYQQSAINSANSQDDSAKQSCIANHSQLQQSYEQNLQSYQSRVNEYNKQYEKYGNPGYEKGSVDPYAKQVELMNESSALKKLYSQLQSQASQLNTLRC